MIRFLPVAMLGAAVACAAAPPAHAGTYDVLSCATSAGNFPNNAWSLRPGKGIGGDAKCGTSAADTIAVATGSAGTIPANTYAALNFTAPAGTTIANWTITRRWVLRGAPAKDVPRPYLLYVYGPRNVFGGAGYYNPGVRDALNRDRAWGGYPSNDIAYSGTTPRAAWRSLVGDAPERTLSVRVGCASQKACTLPSGGLVANVIAGSIVTVEDTGAPTLAVQAAGLLAGGARAGSDPVAISASDPSGIRSVQLIDVTDPAAPTVVGAEGYDGAGTDRGGLCDFTRPAPCPQLSGETVTPTALAAGSRSLLVRVADAAGNVTDSGPYPVSVATPSDRGAPNGAGATATGQLGGGFAGKRKRPRSRTVGYGKRPVLKGRLRNDAGQPVAGALLRVGERVAGSSRWTARGTVRTSASGRWRLRVKSGPSRRVRVGWPERVNDVSAAAKVDFDLRVRGSASLKAPRSVRLGSAFTLRGRLKGVNRKRHVSIVVQGKPPGQGYQTFRGTRTDGKGRIKVRYRFTQPGSRGATFRMRVRLLPTRGWPYVAGKSKTVRVRVR